MNWCVWDVVFFFGYMAITLGIGFWVGRREKSTINEYFRAGNTLPWYAIGFSIIAAGISSEQFVGEMGYAYSLGMPVVNWEWMVFPAFSIFLWLFVPLYMRNHITTMPEYLELRYGPRARTTYAWLTVASYVLANFALVFYTAGFAMKQLWGMNEYLAIWIIAIATGAYTIYGGLASVAWTDVFQCLLLLGGGVYVFFAGMSHIDWDFAKVIGTGERAHLIRPATDPNVPWTALIILALSTNTWYYATDQFINQRCLGAKNEWHSKMGVLLAASISIIIPLATCFPGMIYYTLRMEQGLGPLEVADEAYTSVVTAVGPAGLRGLVVAAVLGAIMSTISGLVNSTSTIVTLDIIRRGWGKDWPEEKLVRFGKWAGGIALVFGALMAPVVMNWQNMYRYCQDIWAPMAAPAVVAFTGGALWKQATERGALACLWLSIATVPMTFLLKFLGMAYPDLLPLALQNPMIWAGGIYLMAIMMLIIFSQEWGMNHQFCWCIALAIPIIAVTSLSAAAVALLVLTTFVLSIAFFFTRNRQPSQGMWDRSMLQLPEGETQAWYVNVWAWWTILGGIFVFLYYWLW
jgi:solute:Na+ symporter, SSS family